jgi:large subunit ribosomal protein L23
MALFGLKKTTQREERGEKKASGVKASASKAKKAAKTPVVMSTASASSFNTNVIIRPRITEKSGLLSQNGIYTFEVSKNANKAMVAGAIASLFKVTPIRVAIINLPAKHVIVRGRRGVVSGVRKAVVTLKKGDKIDFV